MHNEIVEMAKREKAHNLRYRKPIVKDMNLEHITDALYEIQEACSDVHWYTSSESGEDSLLNALDGDEDEAWEFKQAFAMLEAEANEMQADLEEEWVPECFDAFFCAIGAAHTNGGMLGFDEFEGDYFGLSGYDTHLAEELSAERVQRMTKKDLLDAAGQCFRVAMAYQGLQNRYDNLKAAIDILRGQNTALLQQVKQIEKLYETAEAEGFNDYWNRDEVKEFDELLKQLPDRAWVE